MRPAVSKEAASSLLFGLEKSLVRKSRLVSNIRPAGMRTLKQAITVAGISSVLANTPAEPNITAAEKTARNPIFIHTQQKFVRVGSRYRVTYNVVAEPRPNCLRRDEFTTGETTVTRRRRLQRIVIRRHFLASRQTI